MSSLIIIFSIFSSIIIGIGGYFFYRWMKLKKILSLLQLKLFLISLPVAGKEGRDMKREINLSEQLISSLASFGKPFIFEIAVPYVGEEIRFYAAVPSNLGDAFIRQTQSLWSEAHVELSEDYNIFNYNGYSIGAFLSQKERFTLPFRTYEEMNADTFSPILGGLAKINELGEGGAIQFVIRPAPKKFKKILLSVLRSLRKGRKLKEVLRSPFSINIRDFFEAFQGKPETKQDNGQEPEIIDESAIGAIEAKSTKPLFEVNIRLFTSAPDESQANAIFEGLAAGFAQFGAPYRNEFKVNKPKKMKELNYEFSFREFNNGEAMVLNSEEIASVFHLPTPFTEIPRIKIIKSKQAPPPVDLPKQGTLIGESLYRSERRPVYITDDDRRRHLYVIGQTGTGKTNLMLNMANADIVANKGLAIIDPHGEFAYDALSLIPKERYDDVIFFNPGNLERSLGLNMLEYDFAHPEEKTFIVNEMLSIFDKLYDLKLTGGPMFELYMRNALLLLMEDMPNEPATLMEVPRLFSDAEWRKKKLARIKNPVVLDFWEKEAVKVTGETSLANMTTYVGSKFNVFLNNDYMRPIIGQAKSAFNFREIMDSGKILLINLAKGKIGDINANLLGLIIVGKLLFAALSRADIPQEQRKDFYLYIDEFQNFTTDSISVILSEARKYRLNLTIAHQFIAQLAEKIRDSVFGNVGSIIAMRTGAQDAEFLLKQFEPVFNQSDLINLDNTRACVKLLVNGQPSKPFSLATKKAELGERETARKLEELSLLKYGRDRHEVEQEIYNRLRN